MKALVTGGGGFLGRHIVTKLIERGNSVRVLGRREYPNLVKNGVECVRTDITNQEGIIKACENVDAIFHVAALAGIWGKREKYFATNVTGTRNIITACREQGVKKLIYTSTPSVVYGKNAINGGDESLPYPKKFLTYYAETKAIAEQEIIIANDEKLSTCSLRPHLIWGPGDTNLIPRIVDRAKSGKLRRVGSGQNRVSVSYVENVADAHLAACDRLEANSPICGQCYFINEEEPQNCWEFINRILEELRQPKAEKSIKTSLAYAAGMVMEFAYKILSKESEPPMTRFVALQLATSHWFKIDKAKRDLQWKPRVSIEEGLNRLAKSLAS